MTTKQTTKQLPKKYKQFLDFIKNYQLVNGFPPSQREIAQALNLRSVGSIQRYKQALVAEGLLQNKGNNRGLESVEIESESLAEIITLPLLGKVAAGAPIEAIESSDTIEVPASMIRSRGDHFALRVKGQSMIEDAILDGDLVVVKKQAHASNGEIAVAIVDNDATIKRYYKTTHGIELHPANPDYDVIHVPPNSEFRILGVLVGVIRNV